ncbi:unnamed protein product [Prunus armeniaca]
MAIVLVESAEHSRIFVDLSRELPLVGPFLGFENWLGHLDPYCVCLRPADPEIRPFACLLLCKGLTRLVPGLDLRLGAVESTPLELT